MLISSTSPLRTMRLPARKEIRIMKKARRPLLVRGAVKEKHLTSFSADSS